MVGSSNERDDRSTAGLLPKIGFALATLVLFALAILVLLVSFLAMAFGEASSTSFSRFSCTGSPGHWRPQGPPWKKSASPPAGSL